MESRQDVSVLRLHDVLLEQCDDVSIGRNNDVPWVRLPRRLKQLSNETPNDVSVVRIHDFPLVCPTTSPVSSK